MKVFISQPMNGIPEEDVFKARNKAMKEVLSIVDKYIHSSDGPNWGNIDPYEVVFIDTYIKENPPEDAGRLWYLGDSIQLLGNADAIYFVDGWEKAKGCVIEYYCAKLYNIRILNQSLNPQRLINSIYGWDADYVDDGK